MKKRMMMLSLAMIFFFVVLPYISFGTTYNDCENNCNWKKEICYQDCSKTMDRCSGKLDEFRNQLENPDLTDEKREALQLKISKELNKCLKAQGECESKCFDAYFNCMDICNYNSGGGAGNPGGATDPLDPKNPCDRSNQPTGWCPPECGMCQ